jgi:hypothetical protein
MFAHCLYNNYSYSHLTFEISLMNLINSANSGDVDIRNRTITLIRTVVLQRSSSDARVFSPMKDEQK